MDYAIIISLLTALAIGGVVLLSQKMENSKKSWTQVMKDYAPLTIMIVVFSFLFMTCATKGCEPTYDSSEFNWDGKPKDQYRHMRKPLIYDGNTHAPSR